MPEDETTTTDWKDALSDDVRNHAYVKRSRSLDSLVRRGIDAQSEISRLQENQLPEGAVIVPGAGASAEDQRLYEQAIGVPDRAEDYDLGPMVHVDPTRPEDMPIRIDEQQVKELKAQFRKAGLTNGQAQALFQAWMATTAQRTAMAKATSEQDIAKQVEAITQLLGDQEAPARQSMAKFRQLVTTAMTPTGQAGEDPEKVAQLKKLLSTEMFPGGLGMSPEFIALTHAMIEKVTPTETLVRGSAPQVQGQTGQNTGPYAHRFDADGKFREQNVTVHDPLMADDPYPELSGSIPPPSAATGARA